MDFIFLHFIDYYKTDIMANWKTNNPVWVEDIVNFFSRSVQFDLHGDTCSGCVSDSVWCLWSPWIWREYDNNFHDLSILSYKVVCALVVLAAVSDAYGRRGSGSYGGSYNGGSSCAAYRRAFQKLRDAIRKFISGSDACVSYHFVCLIMLVCIVLMIFQYGTKQAIRTRIRLT